MAKKMKRADSGAAAGAGIGTVLLALAQQWPKSPAWRSVFIYLVPAISFGIGALVTWVLVEFQTSINIWTIQRTVKKLRVLAENSTDTSYKAEREKDIAKLEGLAAKLLTDAASRRVR
jgi:hypothetical protein